MKRYEGSVDMQSFNKTKYRFAHAMLEVMKKEPLDKITVKDIAKEADMTRQTFYRNFQDKYDLVNWYFDVLAQKSFKQMGISCTLKEGLIKKFSFIKEERLFFTEAFLHDNQNSLFNYDYECILQFYKDIIEKKLQHPIDEELFFLLRMYCRGSIYMTVEWVRNGMGMSCEEISELLIQALPKPLESLLLDLQG